jgi:hypothetical protein
LSKGRGPVALVKRAIRFGTEAAAIYGRRASAVHEPDIASIFAPAKPPVGVVPEGKALAMDDASAFSSSWASQSYGANLQNFGGIGAAIPMTVLAYWAQRPEYRKISDVPATEMTRRWIKVTATGDDGSKQDRIDGINAALARFKVRDAFRDAIRYDGLLGRGHIFIDVGAVDDELAQPIGNPGERGMRAKVKKGSLKAIRSIDPLWVYAKNYEARNPLSPDFYRPSSWWIMGKEIHATRMLTIVGREVPDILKPAYSFGGLSLTQLCEPYVERWLRTANNVADLVHSFNVFVLKTNMGVEIQGGSGGGTTGLVQVDQAGLDGRVSAFNYYRNNLGTLVIDKDSEEFANVAAPINGLDRIQAQAFEYVVAMAGQPMVKYAGIQPSGLNASSDGEIRVFYDAMHAAQEDHVRDPMHVVLDVIQLSEFGDIDPDIRFDFEPLWAMSEKERAEVEEIEGRTDSDRIDHGVLRPEEVRQNIADDPDSRYPGLDVDDVPDLEEEEAEGLEPKGESGAEDIERLFGAG